MRKKSPPVVLSIAGSDNSCGAGIQADLQTVVALGGYPQTAVTCVVAEVPGQVAAIQPIRPDIVAEQVLLSLDAFPVAAIKTGMLYSSAIIEAVVDVLLAAKRRVPLVVDPVMVASSGDPLLKRSAISLYRQCLFPLATVVTPNLDELRLLSGRPCSDLAGMETAGLALVEKYGCAFLLKGGHLATRLATDLLITPSGTHRYDAPFRRGVDAHGTGCTFSAAIATGLALDRPLPEAVAVAKRHTTDAIAHRHRWKNTSALNHTPP